MAEIKDRSGAEAVLQEITKLIASRDNVVAMEQRAVTVLRERFDPDIAKLNEQIRTRETWLAEWAAANPDEFPKDKKCLDLNGHRIGFRTGRPKLALYARQTWDKVKAAVTEHFPTYLREKIEVDNLQILADATKETPLLTSEDLKKLGLRIDQEESFYIKLKPA